MAKPIPIGIEFYKEMIDKDYYYVDKTLIVRELLDSGAKVTLFTRPRRFGKTLAQTMLKTYFEDERDIQGNPVDNRRYFDGKKIAACPGRYKEEMGKYPVIFLSLKSAKQPSYEMAYKVLAGCIANEFERHRYVLSGAALSEEEKELYTDFCRKKADSDEYATSLAFLSGCLKKYHGRNTVILLDEYDVPLENAHAEGFYDRMISFIRSLFESALKTNGSLELAVLTGCLRISKESIFTGMNNLKIVSILDRQCDEYFGFTEEEVRRLCEDCGLGQKYETVRQWYNGYIFGNANVYNPWSVAQYIDDLRVNADLYPKAYWANTSSNSIVRELLERADESVKEEIEALIDGGSIEKPVHEDITYGEIYETMDNLWNFMFFTGYFRKVGERIDENDIHYLTLRIPNQEVRYIFYTKVLAWFQAKIKQRDMGRLHSAFVQKDAGAVEEELNDIMLETISSMDQHENYYHGLVAGLLTGIRGYITKSNRESGKGRCDLFVKPVSRRKEAFIVEFKVAKKLGELGAKADEALAQIEEKGYEQELLDDNYSTISRYGIAFCGKECLVRLAEAGSAG